MLISDGSGYGQANVKREIFQGDPLSALLLFVIMVPLTSNEKDDSKIRTPEGHDINQPPSILG